MSALLAFLAFLLATLTGHAVPAPGHAGVSVSPVPGTGAVAAAPSRGASAGGAHAGVPTQRPAAAPTIAPAPCGPGEDWDGVDCLHRQNPEEVIGRQETGPNGEECVVIDVELHMSCTPAPAAAP